MVSFVLDPLICMFSLYNLSKKSVPKFVQAVKTIEQKELLNLCLVLIFSLVALLSFQDPVEM